MIRVSRHLPALALLSCFALSAQAIAQGSNRTIFGDLIVDDSKVAGLKPISYQVILCSEGGTRLSYQTVSPNGRYRFSVSSGIYYIVVELESVEVGRVRVDMLSPLVVTYQKDIELEWRVPGGETKKVRSGVVSAADVYKRSAATDKLFAKGEQAFDQKKYSQATALFQQILSLDAGDYQSWTELGSIYLAQGNNSEAERAYARAVEIQPAYLLALLNLGSLRVMLKKYDSAIESLSRAVKLRPDSPEANFQLGEAYLQMKKGSVAVGYLYESLRLDPTAMAKAHLRLAALYDAAGMKDKAAAEYEQFLTKKPDYPNREKLAQYIAKNKNPKKPTQ